MQVNFQRFHPRRKFVDRERFFGVATLIVEEMGCNKFLRYEFPTSCYQDTPFIRVMLMRSIINAPKYFMARMLLVVTTIHSAN